MAHRSSLLPMIPSSSISGNKKEAVVVVIVEVAVVQKRSSEFKSQTTHSNVLLLWADK